MFRSMILCIGEVLTPDELDDIAKRLTDAEFIDGKTTAGWHARLVKHNTQLPKDSPVLLVGCATPTSLYGNARLSA